jgi:hypothetical protein
MFGFWIAKLLKVGFWITVHGASRKITYFATYFSQVPKVKVVLHFFKLFLICFAMEVLF